LFSTYESFALGRLYNPELMAGIATNLRRIVANCALLAVSMSAYFAFTNDTDRAPRSILVRSWPSRIIASRDYSTLYVSGNNIHSDDGTGNVSIIDTNANEALGVIPVGRMPDSMALAPDGRLFVGNRLDGLSVVDTHKRQTVRNIFSAGISDLAITRDGTKLYIAIPTRGLVSLKTDNYEESLISAAREPWFLALTHDDRFLYVNYRGGPEPGPPGHDPIVVYDAQTDAPTPIRIINHWPRPSTERIANVGGPIAISPDNKFAWAVGVDACARVDAYGTIEGCPGAPNPIVRAHQCTDSIVRTTCYNGTGVINIIDVTTHKLRDQVPMRAQKLRDQDQAIGAYFPSFFPDGKRVAVTTGSDIMVFDSNTLTVVGDSIPGIPRANNLTFIPRSNDTIGRWFDQKGLRAYVGVPAENRVEEIRLEPPQTLTLRVIALISIGSVAPFVLLIVSRRPIEFILRWVAGRRWQLVTTNPDRTLQIWLTDKGLGVELGNKGASVTAKEDPVHCNAQEQIEDLRRRSRLLSGQVKNTQLESEQRKFSEELNELRSRIDALVTATISYPLQTQESTNLQLKLDWALSDLPWDLLTGQHHQSLAIGCPMSRVIAADVSGRTPFIDGALRAFVYAASKKGKIPAVWKFERDAITQTLWHAGVRTVVIGRNDMSKKDFLGEIVAADLVHFVGHGEELGKDGGVSLVLNERERVTREEIKKSLEESSRCPSIVFLNACGSSEERTGRGRTVLAGLASPFVNHGAIVVGTQWPVQSTFATDFAKSFYSDVLPSNHTFWWRAVSGKRLAGVPVSAACMKARKLVFDRGQYKKRPDKKDHKEDLDKEDSDWGGRVTDPTWSAYVLYGDVTAQLALE
jgi:DNA-binding beta-propeller fold protein YncE